MIVPLKWLKKYVEINVPLEEYTHRMIMAGTGIEGVRPQCSGISGVVVGKITRLEPHPNADRLQVCAIDTGARTVQCVTGAANVFPGALVPVALDGAVLPGGKEIKKGELRGVLSECMMCSGAELQWKDEDYEGAEANGIMILRGDLPLGEDIVKALGKDDTLIEFEILANRADCMSITGIARETAAVLGTRFTMPEISVKESVGDVHSYASVEVADTKLCPRYMARVFKNIKIAPSPEWMKQALRAAGVRPINNVVDVTNYVMLEMGQPLHAFDLDFIRGRKIIVRRAEPGEKLITLDGKERTLDSDALLIADAEGGTGLAGIMGGGNSEISDNTQTILIESAKFDRGYVRKTSRSLGMNTEAALRMSKGIDIAGVAKALDRAAQLITEIGAGEVVPGVIDVCSADTGERTVEAPVTYVNSILGAQLDAQYMADILNRLTIKTIVKDGKLICSIPTYRMDIEGKADIAEEVARLHGYDEIPMTLLRGDTLPGGLTKQQGLREKVRGTLCSMGYFECVTYSFTGEKAYDMLLVPQNDPLRNTVKLINPLGDEHSLMRTTAAAGMLQVMATNSSRKIPGGAFFEITHTYAPNGNDLPAEKAVLSLGIYGNTDFYAMKGAIETLLASLGLQKPVFASGGSSWHHPGRCATVTCGNVPLGNFGEVHPDCMQAFSMEGRAFTGELDLDAMLSMADHEKRFAPLPRYPALERDLALVVDRGTTVGSIQKTMEDVCGELLEDIKLFDIYEGVQVEKGKKSAAFSLAFRASDRTLKDEDVNSLIEKLLTVLKKEFGAVLRS